MEVEDECTVKPCGWKYSGVIIPCNSLYTCLSNAYPLGYYFLYMQMRPIWLWSFEVIIERLCSQIVLLPDHGSDDTEHSIYLSFRAQGTCVDCASANPSLCQ